VAEDISDYDRRFEKPRETWLAGYFSWEDNVSDGEAHCARDGFDVGAQWMLNQLKSFIFKHDDPTT